MQKHLRKLYLVVVLALLLTGCTDKRTRQLETYQSQMSKFYDNIATFNDTINAIDAGDEDAVSKLLTALDGLNAEFATLRTIEIPEEFASITNITADAADSMEKAVGLYHEAYDNGAYNRDKALEARTWYDRANRCIQIILQVLHGETPSGDDIRITY